MTKTLILNIIILLSLNGNSQTIKRYIRDNYHEIQSIESKDTNYSDLIIIGEAIDESQVVFLGEQDHGDTRTIEAKIRLIKYLHEKHGFNVIAFESDFFGLNRCSQENVLENIYGIWRGCNEYNELNQYVKMSLDSNDPIRVTGFDCRHHSQYSKRNLINDLDSIFHVSNISFTKSNSYDSFINTCEYVLLNEYESTLDTIDRDLFYTCLDTIQTQLHISEFDSKEFWMQEIRNLKQMVNNSLSIDPNKTVFSNIRDRQMAENLLWLTNTKFKNEKIIVWAASFHIVKNIMEIEDYQKYVDNFEDQDLVTMGGVFDESFIGKSYTLGFTSSQGTNRYGSINQPSKHSFESMVQRKGYDYGFINLKDCNSLKPFLMNGTNHIPNKSDWTKNFDGIFYIREMFSCYNKKAPNNK